MNKRQSVKEILESDSNIILEEYDESIDKIPKSITHLTCNKFYK